MAQESEVDFGPWANRFLKQPASIGRAAHGGNGRRELALGLDARAESRGDLVRSARGLDLHVQGKPQTGYSRRIVRARAVGRRMQRTGEQSLEHFRIAPPASRQSPIFHLGPWGAKWRQRLTGDQRGPVSQRAPDAQRLFDDRETLPAQLI